MDVLTLQREQTSRQRPATSSLHSKRGSAESCTSFLSWLEERDTKCSLHMAKKKDKTAPRTTSWYLYYSWFASTKEKKMKIAQLSLLSRRITKGWIYIYSHTMNLLFVFACVQMYECVFEWYVLSDSWLNQNWSPSPMNVLLRPKTKDLCSPKTKQLRHDRDGLLLPSNGNCELLIAIWEVVHRKQFQVAALAISCDNTAARNQQHKCYCRPLEATVNTNSVR